MKKTSIASYLILLFVIQISTYSWERTLNCVQVGSKGCLHWNKTTHILDQVPGYSGFSSNTSVQTKNGPKMMMDLQVGDQLLGLDPASGKHGYSIIKTWLYHNPHANTSSMQIKTNGNTVFASSPLQNFAFVTANGKIGYKFAFQFQKGDQLISFPHNNAKVASIKHNMTQKGVYAPFTEFGNYFVFDRNFHSSQTSNNKDMMILTHALSHMKNPQSVTKINKLLMSVTSLFGSNFQPNSQQIYTNPAYKHMSYFYGNHLQQAVSTPIAYHFQGQGSSSHQNYVWMTIIETLSSHEH